MIATTKRKVFLFVLLSPFTFVLIYLLTAYSFYRENFSHRLYRITLTGLFLEDTEYNRKRVDLYRPVLNILGDGWNIYWTNEDRVILEADRMVGFHARLLYDGTEDDLQAFLHNDRIQTRALLDSLQFRMDQAEQPSAGQPEKRRVSVDSPNSNP